MPTGPRWLALLLLGSLGGNMFLGGFLLGHRPPHFDGPPLSFGGPPPGPGGPGGPHGGRPGYLGPLEWLIDQLPADDAAAVRKIFEPQMAMLQEQDKRRREFPIRIREVLGAEPFDRAAFEALLAANDEAERQLHDKMRAVIVETTAALSPEGRKRLMELAPDGRGPDGRGPDGPRERR